MTNVTCPNCKHTFRAPHRTSPQSGIRDSPAALMRECARLHDEGRTGTEIAGIVGKNQPHVSKLLLIHARVAEPVLKRWEQSWEEADSAHVPVAEMRDLGVKAIAMKMSPRAQLAEFERLAARAALVKAQRRAKHTLPRRRH